jgi:AraC-like DNA-binding protein
VIVIVCTGGAGWCDLPSGRHALEPGSALAIPAGTPHVYGASEAEPWTIWWFQVRGPDVVELLQAAGLTVSQPVVRLRTTVNLVSLISQVITRLERDDATPSLIAASGAAWHALALLAADRQVAAPEASDPVGQAIGRLRAHIQKRFAVAELAASAGLSPSHFAALFKRATGSGVLEYQTRLRMAHARELLDTTALPVAAVGREAATTTRSTSPGSSRRSTP